MTTSKLKSIVLREYEVKRLAERGSVVVIRKPKYPPQQPSFEAYFDAYNGGPDWCWWTLDNKVCNGHLYHTCPFGRVGDQLWCKEAYYDRGDYSTVGKFRTDRYAYAADELQGGWALHPPVHMTKDASRFTVEAVSAKCKRLCGVSDSEAKATGIAEVPFDKQQGGHLSGHIEGLCREWGKRHGPGSWSENPYVWIGEMRRVEA